MLSRKSLRVAMKLLLGKHGEVDKSAEEKREKRKAQYQNEIGFVHLRKEVKTPPHT